MSAEAQFSVETCILAGGLSQRMGSDKSRLKLGRRTMLGQIRATARTLGLPVRVIRRDLVARCGPLGGVYTALKTTKADAVLFLPCDMPFVTSILLKALLRRFHQNGNALFVRSERRPGFPFVLNRTTLPIVARHIARGDFALQNLSTAVGAMFLTPSARQQSQLRNINTREEWARAARLFQPATRSSRRSSRRN